MYVPNLASRVLSPNSDGVDDTQSLSYKLVRPSTVSATLNGPGGVVVALDSGARAPGVYRFSWNGAGQPEGTWTFRVTADDDQGRHSVAERQFAYNNTLGFLSARSSGRRVTASFKLARPARVALRIDRLEVAGRADHLELPSSLVTTSSAPASSAASISLVLAGARARTRTGRNA